MCQKARLRWAMDTNGDEPAAARKVSALILGIWIQEADPVKEAGLVHLSKRSL